MAEDSREYQGGLAEAADAAVHGGSYRNFVAYEHPISSHITLVTVRGEVLVGNPGIEARLSRILDENPNILVLRLDLMQRPGFWPQVQVWAPAVYEAALLDDGPFETCDVIHGEVIVVSIPFTR